jgi:hypothetical protein
VARRRTVWTKTAEESLAKQPAEDFSYGRLVAQVIGRIVWAGDNSSWKLVRLICGSNKDRPSLALMVDVCVRPKDGKGIVRTIAGDVNKVSASRFVSVSLAHQLSIGGIQEDGTVLVGTCKSVAVRSEARANVRLCSPAG